MGGVAKSFQASTDPVKDNSRSDESEQERGLP